MGEFLERITDIFYFADDRHVLMYAAALYLMILAVVLTVYYILARHSNRKRVISGIICVGVTLNDRLDGRKTGDPMTMSYGEYWIGMQDAPNAERYLMNPKRGFLEKASAPDYPVSYFLARFYDAMRAGGMASDPGVILLEELLQNESYCAKMGRLYLRGGRRGLTVLGNRSRQRDRSNPYRVRVEVRIPEQAGKRFEQSTGGCIAERLCITMEKV